MRLCITALILLLTSAVNTTAADMNRLSLKDALDIALRQNPGILAAASEIEAAQANERGARALANPEIIITPGISDAGSDEELSVRQPLEINGQRKIRTRIARAEKEAAEAASGVTKQEVVRSVKQAYWDITRANHVVSLNIENVKLAEALFESAKRQKDVGAAPGSQVVKAQVELSRARQDLRVAEDDLSNAKSLLNSLLSRPAETQFDITDELTFTPVNIDENRIRTSAIEQRPELAEARSALAARKAEVQAVDVRRRPDLALQARQETLGGEGGLAIGISIPILDWGSVRQDKKRAEAIVDAQAKNMEAVRNAVLLDVDSALRDVRRSGKLVEEYEQGVLSQAERLADMARKGYEAGAISYLEVLEAQRTLRGVRTEYYTALADYRKALAQLEWAAGSELSSLVSEEVSK